MIGCLDCERLERQLAACEAKLRMQAQEWERLTGENDGLRRYKDEHERNEFRQAKRRGKYRSTRNQPECA